MTTLEWTRRRGWERFAVKGPRASEWLLAQGLGTPAQSNTWVGDALTIARLGASEFFLEEASPAPVIARLVAALREWPPGVYPVLREDWGFVLAGAASDAVLAEVCNVAFASLPPDPQPVVMTMMAGVSVLVLLQTTNEGRAYRIFCDPTFAPYLGETLTAVVADHGGSCHD